MVGEVIDAEAKARLLRQLAYIEGVPLEQIVAVGDGANDLPMLTAAGLGIAFNAKPVVADAADTTVNVPYLDAIPVHAGRHTRGSRSRRRLDDPAGALSGRCPTLLP